MLNCVEHGIHIKLSEKVYQDKLPIQIKMSQEEMTFVDNKLCDLLKKRCIVQNDGLLPHGFVSNVFLVAKKDKSKVKDSSGFRMICNLKKLNSKVITKHFVMDSIKDVKRLVFKNFWIATCDITDAYLHLRAPQVHLLQFMWRDNYYSFCTMPQGLSSAPYEFTRICRQIAGYLRGKGVYCVFYIDDVIIIGRSYDHCQRNVALVIDTLTKCGFLINYKKSLLTPGQSVPVLGFLIDSRSESICLTEDKQACLIDIFSKALKKEKVKIREFARWIGLCISIFPAFPHGRMHYRQLEKSKLTALRGNRFRYGKTMRISDTDKKQLRWWLMTVTSNTPHLFRLRPIEHVMTTDSSSVGWGCCLNKIDNAGFRFAESELHHPINSKELLAFFYSLKTFGHKVRNSHLLIKSDSMTALADMHKMGSMCSDFRNRLVRKIYNILHDLDTQVSLTFIPGLENYESDRNSRVFTSETSEWSLPQDIFDSLLLLVPDMEMDLFASHLNNKLPMFCSWYPTPGCAATDAFSYDWNSKICFCFPPVSLYLKSFDFVRTRKVKRVYFVVPWHKTAVWFPLMLNLLVGSPHFLPNNTGKRLFLPFNKNKKHQLSRSIRLAFVHLSGNCC